VGKAAYCVSCRYPTLQSLGKLVGLLYESPTGQVAREGLGPEMVLLNNGIVAVVGSGRDECNKVEVMLDVSYRCGPPASGRVFGGAHPQFDLITDMRVELLQLGWA